MLHKSSTDDVTTVLSDAKQLLLKAKSREAQHLSEQLLELRARVKATLALDCESESSSAVAVTSTVTLTTTQQLALWRVCVSLSDAWIEGIGVVALEKNKSQAEKIKELQNDVLILVSTKYSELSESVTTEMSTTRMPPMPRLRGPESMRTVEFVDDSITSMTTNDGHFIDTIDTEAMMASAKVRRAADFSDVKTADESHGQSPSALHWEPSVLSMSSTFSRMSLSPDSQRIFQMHAPKMCADSIATSTSRTLSRSATSSRRRKNWLRLRRPKISLRLKRSSKLKPMAECSTDSLEEAGEVFLGYDCSTTSSSMAMESRTPFAKESTTTVPTPVRDTKFLGGYFFDNQIAFKPKAKRKRPPKKEKKKKKSSRRIQSATQPSTDSSAQTRKEPSQTVSAPTTSTRSMRPLKSRMKWLGV